MAKHKKPVAVQPSAGYADYVSENLGVVEVDVDNMLPSTESEFQAMGSLEEGVSGLKAIDTGYENTSESEVQSPRSDWEDDLSLRGKPISSSTNRQPAPRQMDLDRYPHRRY